MSNTGDLPEPDKHGPGRQGARPGRFRFTWPDDRPRNFREALPLGGYSEIFSVPAMPTGLRVSYWIWVVGGLLGLLAGVVGLFGALVLFVVSPPAGILLLLLVLVALALAAAQIILAMKMKEGWEWARFALTIAAGVSLLIAALGTGFAGGGSWPGFVLSLAATVLMWLPSAQSWFDAAKRRF
ncbi:hypothetical protein [Arthrobacter sp. B3I4]|uniref:hypothetical protein n=1 Tax=Arthrobacter sp. B3I4 TaxID=3042267 RepID=UPI0027D90891|nr:hypothetical protein [Arthrobacter sp. B3I4]